MLQMRPLQTCLAQVEAAQIDTAQIETVRYIAHAGKSHENRPPFPPFHKRFDHLLTTTGTFFKQPTMTWIHASTRKIEKKDLEHSYAASIIPAPFLQNLNHCPFYERQRPISRGVLVLGASAIGSPLGIRYASQGALWARPYARPHGECFGHT